MASLSIPSLSLPTNLALGSRDGVLSSFALTRRQPAPSISLRDEPSVSQTTGVPSYPFSLRSISLGSGNSAVAYEGFCKVIWSLEMDDSDEVHLYLTGEPGALGCWNTDLAIPFSPSRQYTNLWETEIMVPCGIHIKYNYLMMKKTWLVPSYRKGPKLLLSIPPSCLGNEPVHVRDCWFRDVAHRNPNPSWGSWLFDSSLSQGPFKLLNGSLNQNFPGQSRVLKSRNGIPLKQKHTSTLNKGIEEKCNETTFSPRDQPNRNPSVRSTENSHLKDQPVEEPWLLVQTGTFLFEESSQVKNQLVSSMATVPESSNWEKVTTNILISSSACDMRRIAVLENGTLVELFLEPSNNSVLFNNIYLGVIKKMAPQRGGAFVDIGLTKLVFMSMGDNREPFVFNSKRTVIENKKSKCIKDVNHWAGISKGAKIIVQVVKPEEGITGSRTNSVMVTPYPEVESRFWIFRTCNEVIDVPLALKEPDRDRLHDIAKALKPAGCGLKAKPAAAGQHPEELEKDLKILLSTWDGIIKHAKSAAQAYAEMNISGTVPVMLHRGMDWNLAVIYDYFPHKVDSILVDSPRSYHEVTIDLQRVAPDLCRRVELYKKRTPLFDEYKIEKEIDRILCKSVPLPDGGSLVIEQTEAFVSIDVNSGRGTHKNRTSQEKASLKVNLAAAKQIARELRLRDIGGVIIVDFIDMANNANKNLVYEEMKKEIERDRSKVVISEISSLGLMEITREKVHSNDSFAISEPCKCCHATGRVESLETSFSKIERELLRFLAISNEKPDPRKPNTWPRFLLRVDSHMCDYMTSRKQALGKKKTKLEILTQSLKVTIKLETASGFAWGTFELAPLRGETDSIV